MSEFKKKFRERLFALGKKSALKREATTFMGETVWVWELDSAQRDRLEVSRYTQDKKGKFKLNMENARAKFVALVLRDTGDDDAKLLFDPGDELMIGTLPSSETDRVFSIGNRLSGLKEKDADEKDAEKNDSATRESSSSTESAPSSESNPQGTSDAA